LSKAKRNERIGAIVRILSQYPNKLFTFSHFCNMFGSAKSTISEDIVIARDMLRKYGLGDIRAITGAAGGVCFVPTEKKEDSIAFVHSLCEKLSDGNRVLPGGFIYTIDILTRPDYLERIGNILASFFMNQEVDVVATVETKGIPVALMVARSLGVPLVIMRQDNKLTEGSVVTINYVSGSNDRIKTMSLSTRAVRKGQKAIIIDDFMKGGGTARAIMDMLEEFEVEVLGIGVLIATAEPERKKVSDYISLMELKKVDKEWGKIEIVRSKSMI
jgi:purine operon repressor